MKIVAWRIYHKLCAMLNREDGQDLVEYSLILALIALAVTTGLHRLAEHIGFAYFRLGFAVRYLADPQSFHF